jgi:protein cornichon
VLNRNRRAQNDRHNVVWFRFAGYRRRTIFAYLFCKCQCPIKIVGFVLIYLFVLVLTQIIILSDLECDYLNAQQCCSRLNIWSIPKIAAHVFLTFLLLITGHWWLFLANLPMVTWIVYEYMRVPQGNIGLYDPAEIHNRGMVRKHLRDCLIHVGFYLIIFFIYLYW